MKIRSKISLILGITWVCISSLIYFGFRHFLTNNYIALEQKETIEDLKRTHESIARALHALQGSASDWGQWDDSYKFMTDKNQAFITSNMADTSFESTGTNFILFFDTKGKYFYGDAYDPNTKKMFSTPATLINYIEKNKLLINPTDDVNAKHTGIIYLSPNYIFISSVPITTSKATGPIHGHVIMGYYLDNPHLQILSETTQLQISVLPLTASSADLINNQAIIKLQAGNKYFVTPKNEDIVYGYTYLKDINDKLIGIIRIDDNRSLYQQGVNSINDYLVFSILLGIIILVLLWFALDFYLIRRLVKTNQQITDIGKTSEFSKRVHISGNDEISSIILAINNMLEIIELTENQLKHRLTQSSDELEKLSKLNKNLANEVDRHKTVESQLKNQEQELRQLVYHDPLTGLPNRIFFYEYMSKIMRADNHGHLDFAILFLDIDNFKKINDNYSHDAGDAILKHVAEQLKTNIRAGDLAARLAGDEFVVYLNNTTDINEIVENILHATSTPVIFYNKAIKATISIGISLYPLNATTLDELQTQADLAMYSAKKQGGNCYYYAKAEETERSE